MLEIKHLRPEGVWFVDEALPVKIYRMRVRNHCDAFYVQVRDRLIGEATVRLDELNLIRDPQLTVTLQLEPRTDVNVS